MKPIMSAPGYWTDCRLIDFRGPAIPTPPGFSPLCISARLEQSRTLSSANWNDFLPLLCNGKIVWVEYGFFIFGKVRDQYEEAKIYMRHNIVIRVCKMKAENSTTKYSSLRSGTGNSKKSLTQLERLGKITQKHVKREKTFRYPTSIPKVEERRSKLWRHLGKETRCRV